MLRISKNFGKECRTNLRLWFANDPERIQCIIKCPGACSIQCAVCPHCYSVLQNANIVRPAGPGSKGESQCHGLSSVWDLCSGHEGNK